VRRNPDRRARFPLTIAHAFLADRRIRLRRPFEGTEAQQVSSARTAVIAHAINLEGERRRWGCTQLDVNLLAGADAGSRTVAFDPRAAICRLGINARVCEHPIARAGLRILAAN